MTHSTRSALRSAALLTAALLLVTGCNVKDDYPENVEDYWSELFTKGKWRQSQRAHAPFLETITLRHAVAFQEGTAEFGVAERERLVEFLRRGDVTNDDAIVVLGPQYAAGQMDPVTAARIDFLRGELASLGVGSAVGGESDGVAQIAVVVTRKVVIQPNCDAPQPEQGRWPQYTAGCANNANLAGMLDDLNDLERGRPLGPADGEEAGLDIQSYRANEKIEFKKADTETTD